VFLCLPNVAVGLNASLSHLQLCRSGTFLFFSLECLKTCVQCLAEYGKLKGLYFGRTQHLVFITPLVSNLLLQRMKALYVFFKLMVTWEIMGCYLYILLLFQGINEIKL
jgi:hypothetical protein